MFSKNTKIFLLFSLVLISMICVSTVSAQDNVVNDTTVTQDSLSYEEVQQTSNDNNINYDDNKNNEINDKTDLSVNKNLKTQEYEGNNASYSDLSSMIDSSDNIVLENNYVKSENDEVIEINKVITIDGNGFVFDLKNTSTLFKIGDDANVTIENAIIMNNGGNDTTLINAGKLSLYNVTFYNNYVGGYSNPALVYGDSGSFLYMDTCLVDTSNATGGIVTFSAGNNTGIITNSNFTNCNASNSVIRIWRNTNVNVSNCRFLNNHATLYGGAINSQGNLIVNNSYFESNHAENRGGAIALRGGTATIANSNFINNKAYRNNESISFGGTISVDIPNVNITNNTMTGNTAVYGQDIYVVSGSVYGVIVTVYNKTIVEDEELIIQVGVSDDNGNTISNQEVSLVLNEVEYYGNVTDGIADVNVTGIVGSGNYTITALYNASADEYQNSIPGNLEVTPSPYPNYLKVETFINESTDGIVVINDTVKRGSTEDFINITKDIILNLNGNYINARGSTMFHIENGANVVIKNAILYNAYGLQGVLLNATNANVTFDNVTIINNSVYNHGSAFVGNLIDIGTDANFTFNNSLADYNTGAIIRTLGNTTINNSAIVNTQMVNDSNRNNRGWIILDGKIDIYNSLFENNTSQLAGIYGAGQKYSSTIINSSFINNTETTGNGAVMQCGEDTYVYNSTFLNNKVKNSYRDGGVFYNYGGDLTIDYCMFIGNEVGGNGSILGNYYGSVSIENSVLVCQENTTALYNEDEYGRTITANNNWWGTNDYPSKYLGAARYYDYDYEEFMMAEDVIVENWIIMNTTVNPTEGYAYKDKIELTTNFNNTQDTTGTITPYTGRIPDGFNVTYSANKGVFDNTEVQVINQTTTNNYTIESEYFEAHIIQNEAENIISGQATMPDPMEIILNDGNYTTYFNDDGTIKDFITPNSVLKFDGEFNNRNMIIDMPVNLTTYTNQAKLYNSTIRFVKDGENSNISDIIMENQETSEYLILINETSGVNINNLTLSQYNSENSTHAILILNSSAININSSNITTTGPCADIDYNQPQGVMTTSISVLTSDNITIENNNITTNYTGQASSYGTIESIVVSGIYAYDFETGEISIDETLNVNIINNTITTQANQYTYGVVINNNANQNNIKSNNITSIGTYYANAIQIGGPSTENNITDNIINVQAEDVTYGLYVSTNYNGPVTNNNISYNNITGNSSSVYLIELWSANSNTVTYNNFAGENDYVLGIGTYNSMNNELSYNNMTLTGTMENSPVELDNILVETTGIKLTGESNSNTIEYNNITVTSPTTTPNAINTTGSSNNVISYNYLIAGENTGDYAVINDTENTIIYNQPMDKKEVWIIAENITKAYPETKEIIINITEANGQKITMGDITVKYDNTEETYNVTTGEITITYTNQTIGLHEIEITYNENEYYQTNTTTITVNVTKIPTIITINELETAYIGQEVTMTLDIKDQDGQDITTGKLTVSKADGSEIILVDVSEEISIPLSMDDVYNDIIIVSYTDLNNQYEDSTANTTLLIKSQTKITIDELDEQKYNSTINITGHVENQIDAPIENITVIITVNDEETTALTDENGKFTAEYTTKTIGTNNITATTNQTEVYDVNTTTQSFEVTKLASQIIIDSIEDTTYSQTITITGKLTDENNNPISNENINITINDQSQIITTGADGIFSADYTATTVGTNNITAVFESNDYISESNITETFTVDKATLNIELISSTTVIPNTNTPVVIITKDSNGNIITNQTVQISTDESETTLDLTNGINTYNFIETTPGNYTITATVEESENYQANTNSTTITVIEDKDKIIEELNNTIQNQSQQIEALNQTVEEQNNTISELNETIADLNSTIQEQDETIANLTDTLDAQSDVIDGLNATVQEQNATINNLNDMVDAQNETISELTGVVDAQSDVIDELNATVQEQNATINNLTDVVDAQNETINELNDTVAAQNKTIANLNNTVAKQNNTINNLTDTIDAQKEIIDDFNETIHMLDDIMYGLEDTIESQESIISDLNKTVQSQNKTINNLNTQIQNLTSQIENLNEIIENLTKPKEKLSTKITIDPITGTVGNTTTITAQVVDEKGNKVNEGKVVFKVNGITLKDDAGNVIYSIVESGKATLKYVVPKGWTKNITVSAVFSSTENYKESRTNTTNAKIQNGTVTLSVENLAQLENGNQAQFVVKVADANNNPVDGGIVIIKANGVTLKDANGKALQAKVQNGVAVITYDVKLSAKTYNITAVYSNTGYNRAEGKSTLTITKGQCFIKCDPVTTKANTTTINAQILDKDKNPITSNVKVAIKINGKTVGTTTAVNGVINATVPTAYKAGTYTLILAAGETGAYKSDRLTTVLIKE